MQPVKATATLEKTLFNGWLKVHQVRVDLQRGGLGASESIQLNLLQRPGHDSTHVATLKLHGNGAPTVVYKDGDTRPTAALRGTPYVATGIVAGSLDHPGEDAEAIALSEIAEELGGEPIGKLISLGDPALTMPVIDGPGDIASSESDHYYVGVLKDETRPIVGDGGGLEVTGLMKPLELTVPEALAKIRSGGIRENARADVALARALAKTGFVQQLGKWVSELSPALQKRFDTLGLGPVQDPRQGIATPLTEQREETKGTGGSPGDNLELVSKIDAVDLGAPTSLGVGKSASLLDGMIRHLATNAKGEVVPVGKPVKIQTLHVDYDRLKLAQYRIDPKLGPMVRLDTVERPIAVAKQALMGDTHEKLSLQRQDIGDLRVPLDEVEIESGKAAGASTIQEEGRLQALAVAQTQLPGAKIQTLGAPSYASPGQSDLEYHLLAANVGDASGGEFVTIAEALKRCRSEGAGDANTEATLLRLADQLGWLPELGMSVAQAAAL